MLDAALYLILPVVMFIAAMLLPSSIVDENGAYHVTIVASVAVGKVPRSNRSRQLLS